MKKGRSEGVKRKRDEENNKIIEKEKKWNGQEMKRKEEKNRKIKLKKVKKGKFGTI